MIKRWSNEVQGAVNGKAVSTSSYSGTSSAYLSGGGTSGYQAVAGTSFIMQYHALGLLYLMREKDRMAVTKMVQQLGGGGKGSSVIKSPIALCMLVRFARKVMDEDPKLVLNPSDDSLVDTSQRSEADAGILGELVATQVRCRQC